MSEKVEFRYIPKAERDALPSSDFGYVNGDRRLFPIVIAGDVLDAARLIGRAKGLSDDERAAVKKKIISISKKKGFDIPQSWKAEMSDDIKEQLTENILFSAETEDILEITIDNKLVTLQVLEIKELEQ